MNNLMLIITFSEYRLPYAPGHLQLLKNQYRYVYNSNFYLAATVEFEI